MLYIVSINILRHAPKNHYYVRITENWKEAVDFMLEFYQYEYDLYGEYTRKEEKIDTPYNYNRYEIGNLHAVVYVCEYDNSLIQVAEDSPITGYRSNR